MNKIDCEPTYYQRRNPRRPNGAIDWRKELHIILRTPSDHSIRWLRLKSAAQSWITCPCGNQCNTIPRDWYGKPEDSQLTILGSRFEFAIAAENAEQGLDLLNQIEQRSVSLINHIRKQLSITENGTAK